MQRRKVLVIEDEGSISAPLAEALEREGFQPTVAETGGAGLELAESVRPDIVLLDLMLPDMDGRDVCRRLREGSSVPIIMLTAKGTETDRVVGLELGADDYVVKPFSVAELVARMRAVMRRISVRDERPAETVVIGDISLDPRTWTVHQGETQLELTRREFELLRLLMENAGTVISREELMEEVWDPNWFGPTKTLDVHVSSLRKKLGDDPNDPRYIHTVRGVGFRFAGPQELA
ncbi:MAG TPA: response regulator transcription factor [Actinomycetota bacterium]|nr:response regulator transcription factor [Actinomycetota bacterium]